MEKKIYKGGGGGKRGGGGGWGFGGGGGKQNIAYATLNLFPMYGWFRFVV